MVLGRLIRKKIRRLMDQLLCLSHTRVLVAWRTVSRMIVPVLPRLMRKKTTDPLDRRRCPNQKGVKQMESKSKKKPKGNSLTSQRGAFGTTATATMLRRRTRSLLRQQLPLWSKRTKPKKTHYQKKTLYWMTSSNILKTTSMAIRATALALQTHFPNGTVRPASTRKAIAA